MAVIAFAAGSLFGPTLVTAAQKASEVFITNTSADPVPVSGTVSVGNLPATQAVSGTVNVGNLPAAATVSGGATQTSTIPPGGTLTVQIIGKAVAVTFHSDNLAYLVLGGNNVANGYYVPSSGEAAVQTFNNPLPITSVTVQCDALNTSACRVVFAVATI